MIAIYDADNTPEPNALRYLVGELIASEEYGAVIGKFRTRNRNASLLTRFINIETLAFNGWHMPVVFNYLSYARFLAQISLFVVVLLKPLAAG